MEASEQLRRAPQRPPPPNTSSRTNLSTQNESITNSHDIKRIHDKAHKLINSGLEADERNDPQDAMRCYSEGLRLINKALRVDCERLNDSSDEIDEAKQMQQKMTKSKQQITFRIQSLQRELQNSNEFQAMMETENPPSYEDAMREPSAPPDFMDAEMMSLGDSIMNDEMENQHLTSATDLFTIEDGVQIFYISPDGLVSAPSYPSSLHIVKLKDQASAQSQDAASSFIHVNDWVCPLVPGSSPVLQTHYGAYMFPDLMAQQPGSAVGLILPDSLPPDTRQKFEQIIRALTVYEAQPLEPVTQTRQDEVRRDEVAAPAERSGAIEGRREGTDTSTKISKGIGIAAEWISWGLSKGAEKAGELLKTGSEKIRERTKPATLDHKVDPRIKKGLVYARKATHVSVQVTGYLVTKLGEATSALARQVAPHLRAKGEKLLPESVKKSDANGKSKMDGVVEVAASGLKGFGTVYVSLETAAKTLGKSLASETVNFVHHKYGSEAGQVTEHTMYTAGNAAMTAFNANNFGVKAIAKRTAKDTGKAIVSDMDKNHKDERGYLPCESNGGQDDKNYSYGSNGAVGGSMAMKK